MIPQSNTHKSTCQKSGEHEERKRVVRKEYAVQRAGVIGIRQSR